MKVGVYSNNININTNLISMAAQNGCKFTKIIKYNKILLKGNDILIIDLDNINDGIDKILTDIKEIKETVIIGISKNIDLLDEFRPLINVEKKPFNSREFNYYKKEVNKKNKSDIIVNKENDRLYDELGNNLSKTFINSNTNIKDRINILTKKIKISEIDIEKESEFIEKNKLSHVKVSEQQKLNNYKFNLETVVSDDALSKYRAFKLKKMNYSNEDIDLIIQKIKEHNENIFNNKDKSKEIIDNNKLVEEDILSRLRKKGKENIEGLEQKNIELEKKEEYNRNKIDDPLLNFQKKKEDKSDEKWKKVNIDKNSNSKEENPSESLEKDNLKKDKYNKLLEAEKAKGKEELEKKLKVSNEPKKELNSEESDSFEEEELDEINEEDIFSNKSLKQILKEKLEFSPKENKNKKEKLEEEKRKKLKPPR